MGIQPSRETSIASPSWSIKLGHRLPLSLNPTKCKPFLFRFHTPAYIPQFESYQRSALSIIFSITVKMSTPKTILVTGATGKQGGAVISNLVEAPDSASIKIIAVTRDVTSPRAQRLTSHSNITVIHGDMSDPAAMFGKVPGAIWGVYSVQVNSDEEESQGKALIDAAVSTAFSTSSTRLATVGAGEIPVNPTDVKNFAAKYRIEKHLEVQAAASPQKMTYLILRPVTFFENLTTDVHGKGFARMWEQMGDKKLQFVSDGGYWMVRSTIVHSTE